MVGKNTGCVVSRVNVHASLDARVTGIHLNGRKIMRESIIPCHQTLFDSAKTKEMIKCHLHNLIRHKHQ